MRKTMRGFTLIELVVVVSIISILASMLLPALSRAESKARQIQCLSNLVQCGIVLAAYIDDNNEFLPPLWNDQGNAPFFHMYLESGLADAPYPAPLSADSVLACPSEEKHHATVSDYGCNATHVVLPTGTTHRYSHFSRLSELAVLLDAQDPLSSSGTWLVDCPECPVTGAASGVRAARHNGGESVLFLDGHVCWQSNRSGGLWGGSQKPEDMWGHEGL